VLVTNKKIGRSVSGAGITLSWGCAAKVRDIDFVLQLAPGLIPDPVWLPRMPRLLSPEQYEIVEARTSRGVSRVMLFSKAIIQAEWEANAPLREAMAIKPERSRAPRAENIARPSSRAGAAVHVPGAGPASRRPHPC
jgi:hypothetical protein